MYTDPHNDPEILRGHVRDPDYRRVSHGLHLRRLPDQPGDDQYLRELGAWLALLPPDARFTHVTGAGLRGWAVPQLPDAVPVFAATNDLDRRPRRPGLEVSRLTHLTEPELRVGLPVESGAEILLRAARDLAHLDLVALVDAARRRRDAPLPVVRPILQSCRPGVVALRRAWARSTDRSDSVWETYLRLFHEAIDVPVEPQVELHDDAGRFVGKADLLIVGRSDVQEYDGRVHRRPSVHKKDLRRERRIANTTYRRRGYTAEDLVAGDLATLREIDALLGRPHDPDRIRPWRALVAESCLSPAGRARLWNRWWSGPPKS